MRRTLFALLAVTVVASSTGCCCIDRLFCWGCRGNCGYGYGNEGPGGCSSCGGGGGGGCSDCGQYGQANAPTPNRAMAQQRRPTGGHPHVQQRRDADGQYEFAAGPPTGGTTYPYYTNRAPRDFLARNPRDIGP